MVYSKEFLVALYCLDGVGVKHFWQIINSLTKAEVSENDFWVNKGQIWQKISLNKKIEESIYKFNKEHNSYSFFEQIISKYIRVVLATESEYPSLLKQLDFHPPLIFIKGATLKLAPALAVIGSRKITPYGKQVIDYLVPGLAERWTIVSGFMYGVDVYAQQVALKTSGYTVGILGFGFDYMYPAHQKKLMAEFLASGASFISPFAPHVAPKPGNFPARNRVVAGITAGLCVIEAAKESGSLLTASYAADLGRDVWAVPGSIFSPFSAGVQALLNQGASLVREASDINSVLGEVLGSRPTTSSPDLASKLSLQNFILNSQEQLILDLLQAQAASTDELLSKTQLTLTELQLSLFNLQLKNLVEEQGIYWFSRV